MFNGRNMLRAAPAAVQCPSFRRASSSFVLDQKELPGSSLKISSVGFGGFVQPGVHPIHFNKRMYCFCFPDESDATISSVTILCCAGGTYSITRGVGDALRGLHTTDNFHLAAWEREIAAALSSCPLQDRLSSAPLSLFATSRLPPRRRREV